MNVWIKKFPESWHPANQDWIHVFSCSPSGVQTYRAVELEAPFRDSHPTNISRPHDRYQRNPRGAP